MTDVDQYKTYREVGTQLNSDILEAYSDRELIVETATELGIEFDGLNLAYEFESQMPAHFEFALYEYCRDGTTAAERYLEEERWRSETERKILKATVDATPSLFEVESLSESGPRLRVTDLLNNCEERTLLDINLSQTVEPGTVLFFRPVRYDEFTTTSGVSFPFPAEEKTHLLTEHDRRVAPDESKSVSRQRFITFHNLYRDHGIYIEYR
ncbi:hypothetical protein SAMN05443574_1346 [Haloarcula vallismortis]|uniref:Uncharacterized protein n=2 Tax=Haloarcula vallismortis TaxID=28442 RepID=M0JC62_HALVA|nr:hypothetical protein [Haloarcula vallismortis]EMA05604.1 hypothetical protein C437_12498 [Haloarcula vallismortis ATCC 29715]SDX34706.1 hypothetical protein SAMN05443574_1346 [Haloarcula vallismortis]